MKTDEEIENEFNKQISLLSDDQFWEYVRSWYDVDNLLDIMKEWNTDVKEDAIKDLKEMFKQ